MLTAVIDRILAAEENELEEILRAVLHRYAEVFPNWEVSTISIDKTRDRNEQLDQLIAMAQKMKTL